MKAATLERALRLTDALTRAAAQQRWDQVATLADERLALLRELYAAPAADLQTLAVLAQEILDADRAVAGHVSAARDALAARLRALRAGRRAVQAYGEADRCARDQPSLAGAVP